MPGRWPPLEERVLAAAAADGGVARGALPGRLEAIAGNEWIVEEAVEDLLAAGTLREDAAPDGSRTLRAVQRADS